MSRALACAPPPTRLRERAVAVAFELFGWARLVAYLPTLWAIHASADASQHSAATWLVWLGSHVATALWLHERGSGRTDRAIAMLLANAGMCSATLLLIAWHRL